MTTVNHAFKPEPLVKVGKHERMVDINSLTENQRKLLWRGIKTLDPMLAELLKTAAFGDLKNEFNATEQFTVQDFNRFIQAGQQSLDEQRHAHTIQHTDGRRAVASQDQNPEGADGLYAPEEAGQDRTAAASVKTGGVKCR